jgi:hypothetical protein
MNGTPHSGLAGVILGLAFRLVPAERREWVEAMRAEASYLPEHLYLRWAVGCLVAAIKLRIVPMQTDSFRVARWVILVETLGCFGPLTLGWWEITFGASGVVQLTPEIMQKNFLDIPGGTFILVMMIVAVPVALIGPVGLFLGLRYVLLGRGLANPKLGWILIGGLAAYAVAGTIAGLFVGPPEFAFRWKDTLLFNVLPIAAMWHLMYLAKSTPSAPADARLATG